MTELTMQQIVTEYNKLTGKNIKKFETKTIGLKKLDEARNAKAITTHRVMDNPETIGDAFSQIATQIVKQTSKKTYTPKQLEVILNTNQMVIRKKLRKMFPDQAKKGAWKITETMLEELKK